jgi:hypothetical protein
MMENSNTEISKILIGLDTKAGLKQEVYSKTSKVFKLFKQIAGEIHGSLAVEIGSKHPAIQMELNTKGEFEFHLKFSGDTLVFIMHTNVFAFSPDHEINKKGYIKRNPNRGYFGMIQIYNFLSDSITYNRKADMGYLLGRVFVNYDNRFYVDGKKQLGTLFKGLEEQIIDDKNISKIIEQSMLYCLNFDLYVPPLAAMTQMSLEQKNSFNNVNGLPTGKRVGFKIENIKKLETD